MADALIPTMTSNQADRQMHARCGLVKAFVDRVDGGRLSRTVVKDAFPRHSRKNIAPSNDSVIVVDGDNRLIFIRRG